MLLHYHPISKMEDGIVARLYDKKLLFYCLILLSSFLFISFLCSPLFKPKTHGGHENHHQATMAKPTVIGPNASHHHHMPPQAS